MTQLAQSQARISKQLLQNQQRAIHVVEDAGNAVVEAYTGYDADESDEQQEKVNYLNG